MRDRREGLWVTPEVHCHSCGAVYVVEPIDLPQELFDTSVIGAQPLWCAYCGGGGPGVMSTQPHVRSVLTGRGGPSSPKETRSALEP